jgi:hypothetical protein
MWHRAVATPGLTGPNECQLLSFGSGVSVDAAERADEPEDEQDHKYEAQYAAEPSPAVASVTIVATAAAEQNDQQNDDQDRRHCISPFIAAPITFACDECGDR